MCSWLVNCIYTCVMFVLYLIYKSINLSKQFVEVLQIWQIVFISMHILNCAIWLLPDKLLIILLVDSCKIENTQFCFPFLLKKKENLSHKQMPFRTEPIMNVTVAYYVKLLGHLHTDKHACMVLSAEISLLKGNASSQGWTNTGRFLCN